MCQIICFVSYLLTGLDDVYLTVLLYCYFQGEIATLLHLYLRVVQSYFCKECLCD